MSDTIHPWDRRDGESVPAWDAFVMYRDLGNVRSCQKVADSLGKSMTLITRWSSNYEWVDRTTSFDRHLDAGAVEEYKQQTKRIVRQQTDLADKLLRHLDGQLDVDIKARRDPSIRWTTAFTAATKVQGGAMDMVRDKSDQTTDTVRAIERIIERLTPKDDDTE